MILLKKYRLEIIMITPLLLYILGFTIYPIFKTVVMSFQHPYTGAFTLANYKEIIEKVEFKGALFNTVAFALISLTLEMIAAIVIALILKEGLRGEGYCAP